MLRYCYAVYTRLSQLRMSGIVLCCVLLAQGAAVAQDVPPTSIRHGSTPVPDSLLELLSSARPKFIRGFNWGPATRRVNEELHSNFWHLNNPFAWSGPEYDEKEWAAPWLPFNQSVSGMRLVMTAAHAYNDAWLASNLPWYKALNDLALASGGQSVELNFSGTDPFALTEGMGFRFQPEYDVDTASFTPRNGDTQGAVFGFRTRRLGVLPSQPPLPLTTNNTTGSHRTNNARFVLVADSVPTPANGVPAPTIVLDGSWPNNRFVLWQEGAHHIQSQPFNGKRMYLAVNMRRTKLLDTIHDDSVVLRLRITYALCPDYLRQANLDGAVQSSYAHTIVFDSVANPNGTRLHLPKLLDTLSRERSAIGTTNSGYRGQISTLVSRRTGEPARELVITRRMLPRGNEERPDATILAHFIIDTLPYDRTSRTDEGRGLVQYNPYLLRDSFRAGLPCAGSDSNRIAAMNVQVEYEGRSDIAIDWVQVGTENMTWLTQGWYDRFADTVYRQILTHLRSYNKHHAARFMHHATSSVQNAAKLANGLHVYRWFNRDEGGEQYWEGMRYQHMLFDSLTTTERGFGDDLARYNHSVLSDLTWQGTMPFPDVNTVAPYYQHGYNASGKPSRLFLQHEWGMQNIDVNHRIDYDVRWGHHPNGSVALPADTTTMFYPGGSAFASGSWQQRYESFRYQLAQRPQFLFDTTRAWIANPWVFSQWQTDDSLQIPVAHIWRFPTGEEVRLELYSQLILGAKGFALFWGANKHNATRPADYLAGSTGSAMGFAYAPPPPPTSPSNTSSNTQQMSSSLATHTRDALKFINASLASDSTGPDYLEANNRTGLYQALDQQHPYTVANIARTLGVAPNKLYMGFRSSRMAIKEVFDRTHRAEDTLARLQLVTWYSKGFRTWTVGDTSALTRIIRTDAKGIQTRHPYRVVPRKRILNRNLPDVRLEAPSYEPFDSSFVELTLLRDSASPFMRDSASPLPETFVLGVLNRRCNPFDYADVNVKNFVSYGEFEDALRKNRSKSGRYRQQGAREIVLHFNYAHPDGRRRTLHVRSMGEESDAALGIVPLNTVIPQDGTLSVYCMPGEGKMLYIESRLDER